MITIEWVEKQIKEAQSFYNKGDVEAAQGQEWSIAFQVLKAMAYGKAGPEVGKAAIDGLESLEYKGWGVR